MTKTLDEVFNMEMLELSIRLHCINNREWTPTVDFSVANALANESTLIGKRCSYIGSEDIDENGATRHRSLNVEELALEEYSKGTLPKIECNLQGGGWKGWHSEGLHVRVLFRILVLEPLLKYDFFDEEVKSELYHEQFTIFLNPYQSSPLDLHVGHCMLQKESHIPVRSFYERRRAIVDSFLRELSQLSSQDLSNLIFTCVTNRKEMLLEKGRKLNSDPQLLQDMKEVRTLSLIAVGIGGKLLAAMFRCLCYDYRQYSGGLADLTLVRAKFQRDSDCQIDEELDWGRWIGESFAVEKSSGGGAMLLDRDDEFLGGALNDKQKSSSSSNGAKRPNVVTEIDMDGKEALELMYNGQLVDVETIFVEVKSVNDTLDERQEDWLNVIGGFGEARVCKFESSKKKKAK